MESERVSLAKDEGQKSMRWVWVLAGVAVGAIVITVFLNIVDRYLDRLAVDGLIGSLTVLICSRSREPATEPRIDRRTRTR